MPTIEVGLENNLSGGIPVLFRDLQITDAQMKAIRATPLDIVPAAGAGFAIIPLFVQMVFDVTTTGYTVGTNDLALEYASGADLIALIETVAFIDQATDQVRHVWPILFAPTAPFTPVANSAVRLINAGAGEFTGGNAANTFSIRVYYLVAPTLAFN